MGGETPLVLASINAGPVFRLGDINLQWINLSQMTWPTSVSIFKVTKSASAKSELDWGNFLNFVDIKLECVCNVNVSNTTCCLNKRIWQECNRWIYVSWKNVTQVRQGKATHLNPGQYLLSIRKWVWFKITFSATLSKGQICFGNQRFYIFQIIWTAVIQYHY